MLQQPRYLYFHSPCKCCSHWCLSLWAICQTTALHLILPLFYSFCSWHCTRSCCLHSFDFDCCVLLVIIVTITVIVMSCAPCPSYCSNRPTSIGKQTQYTAKMTNTVAGAMHTFRQGWMCPGTWQQQPGLKWHNTDNASATLAMMPMQCWQGHQRHNGGNAHEMRLGEGGLYLVGDSRGPRGERQHHGWWQRQCNEDEGNDTNTTICDNAISMRCY